MKLKLNKQIHYIDNKDFKTIQIRVLFHFKEKLEELALSTLLPNLLNYMNEDYPTEDSFKRAKMDKYILNTSCVKHSIGLESCFSFNMVIPDEETLGEDLLEEQFKFFESFIYKPLIIDGGFSSFELDREKENLKTFIDNSYNNIRPYQALSIKKLIDTEGILSMDIINNTELIDKVNPINLYEFYKDKVLNNSCHIFVMGNFDHKKMDKILNKYIVKCKFINELDVKYDCFLKPRNEVQVINEKKKFKDSSLSLVYKIKDMSDDDKVTLGLIYGLLTSLSSRLLSKKLRDEEELIYSTKVLPYGHYGCFEITAFINKKNKDEVHDKILEVMNDLRDKEMIDSLLDRLKERKRISLIKSLDDKFFILNDYIAVTLKTEESQEDIYKKMLKITSEDINKLLDRFVLDTIYYIEEDNND